MAERREYKPEGREAVLAAFSPNERCVTLRYGGAGDRGGGNSPAICIAAVRMVDIHHEAGNSSSRSPDTVN